MMMFKSERFIYLILRLLHWNEVSIAYHFSNNLYDFTCVLDHSEWSKPEKSFLVHNLILLIHIRITFFFCWIMKVVRRKFRITNESLLLVHTKAVKSNYYFKIEVIWSLFSILQSHFNCLEESPITITSLSCHSNIHSLKKPSLFHYCSKTQ